MVRFRAVLLGFIMTLMPTALAAQNVMISIGGFAGVFVPTSDFVNQSSGDDIRKVSMRTGLVAGARAGVWFTGRLAVELEAAYVNSDMEVFAQEAGSVVSDTLLGSDMFYGSVNLMYSVFDPPLDPISIYVAGGVGFIGRGGNAFEFFSDQADFAGTLGLGLRYEVSPIVILRLDLRDYISSFSEQTPGAESKLQNDLLISLGLDVTFGG